MLFLTCSLSVMNENSCLYSCLPWLSRQRLAWKNECTPSSVPSTAWIWVQHLMWSSTRGPYICEVHLNHGEPKATPGRHLTLEQLFPVVFVRLQTAEGTICVFGGGSRLMLKWNGVNCCYGVLIEGSDAWAAVAVGCGVLLVLLVLLVLAPVVVWKKRRDSYGMV